MSQHRPAYWTVREADGGLRIYLVQLGGDLLLRSEHLYIGKQAQLMAENAVPRLAQYGFEAAEHFAGTVDDELLAWRFGFNSYHASRKK